MFRQLMALIFTMAVLCSPAVAHAWYIYDNVTGGQCGTIGIWNNETKTCTMTMDRSDNNTIVISGHGITLDGNGHTITGYGTSYNGGVRVAYGNNVTVKNLNITWTSCAISVGGYASGTVIETNNLYINHTGICLSGAVGTRITENNIDHSIFGITVVSSKNTVVFNNNFIHAGGNFIKDTAPDLQNNAYNLDLPVGGNYWSNLSSGLDCEDSDDNGLCDEPQVLMFYQMINGVFVDQDFGTRDYLPWAKAYGWNDGVQAGGPPAPEFPYHELMARLSHIDLPGFQVSVYNLRRLVNRGHTTAAIKMLEVLSIRLEGMSGKKLPADQVDILINLINKSIVEMQ